MTWTEKDGFKLIENQLNVNDADTVAVANFTNAINETGWSYLEVTTYPQFPDKVQVGGSVFEFHQGILVFGTVRILLKSRGQKSQFLLIFSKY